MRRIVLKLQLACLAVMVMCIDTSIYTGVVSHARHERAVSHVEEAFSDSLDAQTLGARF